ncbi:MAG: phosphatidate cytidylyltransferase [Bacteroidales bacterium]|nr:phosphatidate cytidylyltransferase [Bacteroidales bacterium]
MKELLIRTISGIIFVTLFLGSIIFSELSMLAFVLAVLVIGLAEFRKMFSLKAPLLFTLFLVAGAATISMAYLFFAGYIDKNALVYLTAGYLAIFTLYYLLPESATILETGRFLFNFFWITGSMVLFMYLGWIKDTGQYDPAYMIILLAMIWIYDAGAYIFGSIIGRTPLAPKISPGKTVEGLISGIALNALAGYIVFRITGEFTAAWWIFISLIVSLGGTAGDLFESKMKREAGVKDSGNVIPGHGGILDRFDSLYFSTPVFLIVLMFLVS